LLDSDDLHRSQYFGTAVLMMAISHVDWISSTDGASGASPAITRTCITGANSQGWIEGVRNCVVCLFEKMPHAKLQGFSTLVILMAAILVAVTMTSRAALRSSEQRLHGHWWFMVLAVLAFVLNVVAFFGSVLIVRRYFDGWTFPVWVNFLANPAWVWPFLILFSAQVREIMVQYVGDVAIYVRPNKLDRFDAVRTEIKAAARSVVSALFTSYELKTDPVAAPKFQYDKIALVGHSLGSVIAYDTLNRLMLDDWLCNGALQIAERTATLVTFGSPLNKTAFLFTIQGTDTSHIRERLAATVQPLIMSYRKFRKFKWINVYSRNDIVSGLLKFYDLPGYQDPPVPEVAVQNVKDRDAAVPLMAHVAYWKNKTVWTQLLEQIAP
jgi:succinate dehydrogenase hydrophobic anchor subunit